MLATVIAGFSRTDLPQPVRSVPIPPIAARARWSSSVAPVRGRARDIFSFASAIIVATPVAAGAGPDAGLIAGLFDLTRPRRGFRCRSVAGGHPPRDVALRLGVTEATARTTLKRILAKTGTAPAGRPGGLLKSAAGPR